MSQHPTKRLSTPEGDTADIDVLLAPLAEALWAAGYETIGSCQDLGDSLTGYGRKHDYWLGYALLEMPLQDACRLLDAIKDTPQFRDRMHWAADGAWDVTLPVMAAFPYPGDDAGVSPWAQLHFPNDQIDDLVKVITAG